jgi:hypothetical protein
MLKNLSACQARIREERQSARKCRANAFAFEKKTCTEIFDERKILDSKITANFFQIMPRLEKNRVRIFSGTKKF